jgi:plasmid segregation protein ParM
MKPTKLSTAIKESMNPELVVASIDVGFGYTKIAIQVIIDGVKTIKNFSFPSIAACMVEHDISHENSIIGKRNTVKVSVDGKNYEVGPDSELIQSVSGARNVSENYSESPEYLALLKGALSYINEEVIDVLVVGLPVQHMAFKEKVDKLNKLVKGRHTINKDLSCEIKSVTTIEQPLGGLLNYIFSENSDKKVAEQFNFILDPGQQTLDWLGVKGTTPIPGSMGSHPQSMGNIINLIQGNISIHIRQHFDDPLSIEKAIETGIINIKGKDVDLSIFIDDRVRTAVTETLSVMKSKISSNLSRTRNIIIVGGPAKFFEFFVRKVFPDQNIILSPNGMFSNVNGYQLLGQIKANKMNK